MIKLVVSDVDGTILKKGETKVSENVFEAIEKLKSAGKTVAISSGRTYGSLENLFAPVKKDLYFICCDGAVIIHNDKVVYCKQIGAGDVMSILRRPEYEDCGIMLCTPKVSYVIRGSEDFSITAERQSGEDTFYIENLYSLKDPIIKIAVWSKDGKAVPLNFLPKSLRISYLSDEWCEYTSAISDKGLAVSDLQMRLYMTKFDTAAIGDGINDIVMMKKAKMAVSANKSYPGLLPVCNYHTDDVAGFLENLCDQ
ncbi:MAG: HAD hydrolase family protein [Clostridia bacterium]|nr:HAD hydrolase family protein [Clostridia bacterium]